ncbi:MAG: hypothetical protein GWP19_00625 [Planctomycetia bacterium]|nr:hypothetical protein [Planctomycetia bacterium]
MSITTNKNGSANIELTWSAYSQGANPASGLILYWKSMVAVAITGATQAVPCVITAPAHGLSTGDTRRITDIVGMIELNDEDYKVTVIDSDNISLEGVDSTAYTAYTSGGVISPGPIVSTDNAVKLAVDTTSHTLEGVVSDMVYRFGLAAYKTTLTGMAVGYIQDHSTWRKVQAATSVDYIGNINGEAAADIKSKVQGMSTSGDFVGKGTGNQRIVIDYVNGRIYFYDASDVEILKIGEDVIGTYDGIDLGNIGVIAGGGNSRSGNQSPIYLSASTNHSSNVLNQVIFVENVQIDASNSATIRGIKGIATHLGTGTAIGIYGEASSTGGVAWGGYFEGDVYVNGDVDIVGSYKMDGSDIIDTSGYQTGVLKTRQTLLLGYNAEISVSNTYEMFTTNGVTNGQGFRMPRAGKITALSVQLDVTEAYSGSSTLQFKVYKNGVAELMEVTFNSTNASSIGDNGLSTTSNAFTFSAGDRITVQAIQNLTIVGKADDIAVIVEFES